VNEDGQNASGQAKKKEWIEKSEAHLLIPNFKISAYRQAGKCQMNVKVQIQSVIPPRPPLEKGGWGDFTFGLWI
jgi:hypothetical protein